MVSKANATKGSSQAIDYIMNDKGHAEELDRHMISGENGKEILAEMREVQNLNSRCQNNTYSIVLSPDASQTKFSNEELKELTQDHLKNLGLENHQYIAYVHNSTDNQHVHIIANRIDFEGKAHSDKMISLKAQESAQKLAQERGLFTAKEIQQMKQEPTKELRAQIRKDYNLCASQSKSFEQFESKMHDKGYNVNLTTNKQGEIQGFRIEDRQSGMDFKASEIGKEVRWNKLQENFKDNGIKQETKDYAKSQVEQAFGEKNIPLSISDLTSKIENEIKKDMNLDTIIVSKENIRKDLGIMDFKDIMDITDKGINLDR
jgi:hypothetical protein